MEQNSAEIIILLNYLIYCLRICSRSNWIYPYLLFLPENTFFFDCGEKNEDFLCNICLMETTSQKHFFPQKEMSKEKQNRKELVKTIGRFFWFVFSHIQSKYRKIRTRKNSVFGQFSRSVQVINKKIRETKILKNIKHTFGEKESLAFT